ncbi:hypothetical protein C8R47DRAFT_654996 [Mycena vitilis]|nr:hypothetical protein C8R47DRAFT_654996 [Mycena vitilis]
MRFFATPALVVAFLAAAQASQSSTPNSVNVSTSPLSFKTAASGLNASTGPLSAEETGTVYTIRAVDTQCYVGALQANGPIVCSETPPDEAAMAQWKVVLVPGHGYRFVNQGQGLALSHQTFGGEVREPIRFVALDFLTIQNVLTTGNPYKPELFVFVPVRLDEFQVVLDDGTGLQNFGLKLVPGLSGEFGKVFLVPFAAGAYTDFRFTPI